MGSSASPAHAQVSPRFPTDWRQNLAEQFMGAGTEFSVRALQDGLEVWEVPGTGYMVVDASRKISLESSVTARSPFRGAEGDLAYLGPGIYVNTRGSSSRNLFTGESLSSNEVRPLAVDTASMFHESAMPVTSTAASGGVTPMGLSHVSPGDVKSRVPYYGYVTGSYVYPNNTGICGWVAGSIVTRYWHARSAARTLLPYQFRNGSNMTSSPNFATYLQGSTGNSTWAYSVYTRLLWNASNQGVGSVASWAIGNSGMFSEVDNGRPVIVFGSLPINSSGSLGAHAVVGYGKTYGGYLITHYGWSGYEDIVLNAGLIGSNTRFRLT